LPLYNGQNFYQENFMRAWSIQEASDELVNGHGSASVHMLAFHPALVQESERQAMANEFANAVNARSGPVIRVSIDDAAVDRQMGPSQKKMLPLITRPQAVVVATLDLSSSDQGGPRDLVAAGALMELANMGKHGAKVAVIVVRNPLEAELADMVWRHARIELLASPAGLNLAQWRSNRPSNDSPTPPKPSIP
jgi:hypothetical protein